MWELDYKENWVVKNWCFWTVVLEKTFERPLDCKEIQPKPVNPKGNQSWIFIGRTDAEAETPILWPSAVKNWLTGKDPDAGKDWRQEEKGTIQDKMVDGVINWMDVNLSKLQELVMDRKAWRAIVHGVTKTLSHVQLFATLWTVTHQALCPWNSPGKYTGMGCRSLLPGILYRICTKCFLSLVGFRR